MPCAPKKKKIPEEASDGQKCSALSVGWMGEGHSDKGWIWVEIREGGSHLGGHRLLHAQVAVTEGLQWSAGLSVGEQTEGRHNGRE